MKSLNKGSIPILLLVIVTIAILGGGAYYLTTSLTSDSAPSSEEITLDPNRPMLRDRSVTPVPSSISQTHITKNGNVTTTVKTTVTNIDNTLVTTHHTTISTSSTTPPTSPSTPLSHSTSNTHQPHVNGAPFFATIPSSIITQKLKQISFTIIGTDPDGDVLTYSVSSLPTGATFDPATRKFNWLPNTTGTFNVSFTVSDGHLSHTEIVQIKVSAPTTIDTTSQTQTQTQITRVTDTLPPETNPTSPTPPINVAPVINPVSVNPVTIGQLIQFTITASDSNGDPLTYSSGTLPQGAAFDPSAHKFTWTPTIAGTYTVAFKVSDGRLESTISVQMIAIRQTRSPIDDQNPSPRPTTLPTPDPIIPTPTPTPTTNFKVFDSLGRYTGKPEPFMPNLISEVNAWGPYFFNIPFDDPDFYNKYNNVLEPSEVNTRSYAQTLPHGAYVGIDIEKENWPADIRATSTSAVNATIQRFKSVISWMKSERPDLHVGIYSMVPITDFWTPTNYQLGLDSMRMLANGEVPCVDKPDPRWVYCWARGGVASPTGDWADPTSWRIDPTKEFTAKYIAWQAANDYLAPLAQSVDFIAPHLYPTSTDIPSWNVYAKEVIKEAQQYGKPVYPYIWQHYDGGIVSKEFYRNQLDVIKNAGAQGVIVWDDGYWAQWQEFPWVTAIREFVRDNNIQPSNSASVYNSTSYDTMLLWRDMYYLGLAIIALYIIVRTYSHIHKTSKK